MGRKRPQTLNQGPSKLADMFPWRETTRRGEETTIEKYTIRTKGLRIQTVGNNETAQTLPSNGFHQRRDLND